MKRRFKAATLSDSSYRTNYPMPTTHRVDVSTLNGGLNLWELEYKLDTNQSPDLLNVYWKDGCLSSRPGQDYIHSAEKYGEFKACYGRPWPDDDSEYFIAHKGTSICQINYETGEHNVIYQGLPSDGNGTFFVFKDTLYYLGMGKYYQIDRDYEVSEVDPYVPITVMNRTPSGSGGDTYQPENRISPYKRVQFTSDGSSTAYYLPYQDLDEDALEVKVLTYDSTSTSYSWITYTEVDDVTKSSGNVYQVDREKGIVTFKTAPAQTEIQTVNNVDIKLSKYDEDTANSVLLCSCAVVYGGSQQLAVVVGGTPAQPNAYFWSGNNATSLDPTYFPFDYYNFAGSNELEYITGFGKQQSMLIIFKEHSIGRTSFGSETIDERIYLTLDYVAINDTVGCNVPNSIQLVQNNLTFANTYSGVYVLADTSAANENNVKRISRNVNGDGTVGLLYDLKDKQASSYDDNQRYWLVCSNGKAYIWDYTIKSYSYKEESLSWFLFDNIMAKCWITVGDDKIYCTESGNVVKFIDSFVDFGEGFMRRYTFATQIFGTYEYLKDVLKVIFAVRTDTNSTMKILYRTDYETRYDLTPIKAYGWVLVPRILSFRGLRPLPFAATAVRVPRCFHIRHFSMTLSNDVAYTDMSVVSAQIVYRYVREDR